MPTHALGRPKVFRNFPLGKSIRNFHLPPRLDLWLIQYSKRAKMYRKDVCQQALTDFLRYQAPDLKSKDLDLWLTRFCDREQVSRSRVFQQALADYLHWHYPEGASVGSIITILKERWATRGEGSNRGRPNGPSKATFEQSCAVKLHKKKLKGQSPDPKTQGRRTSVAPA